jgi:hypothetical protein
MKWYVLSAALRDAVYVALTDKPCRYGVVPGEAAWDDCTCGMLTVAQVRTYVSDEFPLPLDAPVGIGCDGAYEVTEFLLTLLRCSPGPGDGPDDIAPSVEDLDTAAQAASRDGVEMLNAAVAELCTMKIDGDVEDFLVTELIAVGPQGDCTGSELRVTVALLRG